VFGRIEGEAGNLNAFAYVLNRPTAMADPTGREGEAVDFVMGGGGFDGFIGGGPQTGIVTGIAAGVAKSTGKTV
jgi:hypothetical protein